MSLVIEPSVTDKLPSVVRAALSKMTTEEQGMFAESFGHKKKGVAPAYLWWFFLTPGAMLLYLRKIGLFWLFIAVTVFTMGFGGVAWMVVELFIIPKRVREYNADLAVSLLRDQKMLAGI